MTPAQNANLLFIQTESQNFSLFSFAEPAARDLGWTSASSRSGVLSISLMSFVLLCQRLLAL